MSWCLAPDLLATIKITSCGPGKFQITNLISDSKRTAYPEEIIRQLMYSRLVKRYHYDPARIHIEFPIQMGSTKKRADLVVLDPDLQPLLIVEAKTKVTDSSIDQLRSYLQATSATYGMVVDAIASKYYEKSNGNKICEVNDVLLSHDNVSSDYTKQEPIRKSFGVSGLIKEVYAENDEKWFLIVGDSRIEITLKDLNNYQKVQLMVLESGQSLLNYNPTASEWRSALHSLIQSARIVSKKNDFQSSSGYLFLMDIAAMISFGVIDPEKYFSVRREGNLNCGLNMLYKEYEKYKAKQNDKALNKKLLLTSLRKSRISIDHNKSCAINRKTVRAHILDTTRLPKELVRAIVEKAANIRPE